MDITKPTRTAAPPAVRKRRRALPIVDARFQLKYTAIITLLGVGITAVLGGFLYDAHQEHTRLLDLGGNEQLRAQVARGDRTFLLYLVLLTAIMGVTLAIWGLIVTHRISGPLYMVARYLAVLGDGHYPDVRPLRKRDELKNFFASFEATVSALREHDVTALHELDETLARLRQERDSASAVQAAVEVLERHRAELARRLGGDIEVD